jgi:hypothetical protein
MSNDGAKRLSLLLNLNPTISKADRHAIGVLQHWYRQAKNSHSDPADLEASVKGFHRDIYLAGLFLHQLNAGLARQVANALTEPQVSLSTLLHLLNSSGFAVSEKASAPSEFSHQQLTQLHDAISNNNQHAQIDAMSAEIRALTGMVQEQQQQLQRLTTRAIRQTDELSSKEQSRTQEESLAGIAAHIREVKKVKQKGIF